MGERLDAFLKTLTHHEFSIYVGYQHESFLKHTKERVRQEIHTRELSKKQMEIYFKTKIANTENGQAQCKRCGSQKFIVDEDTEHIGTRWGESVIKIETNRCRLCHYNPSKEPEKNFWKRLKRAIVDDNKTSTITQTTYWVDDLFH